jgi:uncharacterized protein YbjT (DUF2867 family)
MKVLIFGASGMVGRGVLFQVLAADDIEMVTIVVRSPLHLSHEKLKQIVISDDSNLSLHESELQSFDACFFCLGISSSGLSAVEYRRITLDLTLNIARFLAFNNNPAMKFIYVSGAGTDSSEQGKSMWARIKGKTENELMKLPFKAVYLFRPGLIMPMHGIRSKTKSYRIFYQFALPILTILRYFSPNLIATTDDIGVAMLNVARSGDGCKIVEAKDIIKLAKG